MSGITDLPAIIRRGDVAALENMLAENPGLANARDDRGNSPLLIATYFGRHEMVRRDSRRSPPRGRGTYPRPLAFLVPC
jgi:ankyrin repeat protein